MSIFKSTILSIICIITLMFGMNLYNIQSYDSYSGYNRIKKQGIFIKCKTCDNGLNLNKKRKC